MGAFHKFLDAVDIDMKAVVNQFFREVLLPQTDDSCLRLLPKFSKHMYRTYRLEKDDKASEVFQVNMNFLIFE